MKSDYVRHPEQKPDEVFMGNCTTKEFSAMDWNTKRMGFFAYNVDESKLDNGGVYNPTFVKRQEVEEWIQTHPEIAHAFAATLET